MSIVDSIVREYENKSRPELLAICERIKDSGFTEPQDGRDRFDSAMSIIERPALATRHNGPRTSYSVGGQPIDQAADAPAAEPAPAVRRNPASPLRQREALDAQLADLERADLPSYQLCIMYAGQSHSLANVRRQLPTLPPGYLAEIQVRANEIEDLVFARDERAAADAERQARFAAALANEPTAEEAAESQRIIDEAREIAEHRDSTPERLRRIEEALLRVASALESRQ